MTKKLYMPIVDNGMGLSRTSWAASLLSASLSVLRDYVVDVQSISYPYPDGAMNIATQSFMESDADEMVVIDTDIEFKPSDLAKLLSHDVPLVFGLYPMKQPGLFFPVEALPGESMPVSPGLHEMARCAKGFMRVKRSVFELMAPYCEEITHAQTGKKQREFWKTMPGGHSEDFYFCNRYRECGGKVMCDTSICCRHEGSATYPIMETIR